MIISSGGIQTSMKMSPPSASLQKSSGGLTSYFIISNILLSIFLIISGPYPFYLPYPFSDQNESSHTSSTFLTKEEKNAL